jgi:hypothetical protein
VEDHCTFTFFIPTICCCQRWTEYNHTSIQIRQVFVSYYSCLYYSLLILCSTPNLHVNNTIQNCLRYHCVSSTHNYTLTQFFLWKSNPNGILIHNLQSILLPNNVLHFKFAHWYYLLKWSQVWLGLILFSTHIYFIVMSMLNLIFIFEDHIRFWSLPKIDSSCSCPILYYTSISTTNNTIQNCHRYDCVWSCPQTNIAFVVMSIFTPDFIYHPRFCLWWSYWNMIPINNWLFIIVPGLANVFLPSIFFFLFHPHVSNHTK